MIVRINQLELSQVERDAGWPAEATGGAIKWPADMRAFELLILGQDERNQPLSESFRQTQLRHMIPEATVALSESGEQVVVRLDGPLTDTELVAAFRRLTDASGKGRFAFSAGRKLQPGPPAAVGSVRLAAPYRSVAGLCADPTLGLDRSVRLRAIAVPEPLANTLLDIDTADDPRWGELMPRVGFALLPSRSLRSIHILTRRYDAATVKSRIMQRLLSGATDPDDATV